MTSWLRSPNSRKSLSEWADEVASQAPGDNSSTARPHMPRKGSSSYGAAASTSDTSTAVVRSLPLPATHTDRHSIASGRQRRAIRGHHFQDMRLWFKELLLKIKPRSTFSSTLFVDESIADSTHRCANTLDVKQDETGAVEVTVVDRVWPDEYQSVPSVTHQSDKETPTHKSNRTAPAQTESGETTAESLLLRSRLWMLCMEIFNTRFEDEKKERRYQEVRRNSITVAHPHIYLLFRRTGMSRRVWRS